VDVTPKKRAAPQSPPKVTEAAAHPLALHVADKKRSLAKWKVVGVVVAAVAVVALVGFAFRGNQRTKVQSIIAQGDKAWETDDYDLAISCYSEALRLDPTNAEALWSRGTVHANKRDVEKAIKDCSEAIRLQPANAQARGARGFAYWLKRDYDSAITDCTEAIRLDPNELRAYFTRGKALHKTLQFDKAILDFGKAETLNDAQLFYLRGDCYLELKKPQDADRDFRRAMKIDPTLKEQIDLAWKVYRNP
jgi:tetratricopeptide (TPR) repeat protein